MKALKELEMSKNNVSTEAERKEATEFIRKENRLQLSMVKSTKEELWDLWGKTDSQISRDCILQAIVAVGKEIEKIKEILR